MKRTLWLLAFAGLLLPASANAQTQTAAPAVSAPTPASAPTGGRKKRVAIFDFDYATVHGGVSAIFGQDVDIGKGIADLLGLRIVQDKPKAKAR